MRYLSNEEKRKKADETRKRIEEAEESYKRVMNSHQEIFDKMIVRNKYSEETKASLRRGFESNMEGLKKRHQEYIQTLRRSS